MKYFGPVVENVDIANKTYVDNNGGGGGGSYTIVTLAQLQTGTDTSGYLISPKVLADYIASLNATNVAY